jgi:hypothetical protein
MSLILILIINKFIFIIDDDTHTLGSSYFLMFYQFSFCLWN